MIDVVCGVIWSSDGRYLLAQRPQGRIWSGYWEFPGGKIEPGEPAEAAMTRELQEELGINVTRADPWLLKVFEYPHATVRLHFFHVRDWSGTPHGLEGQALHWQAPSAPCAVEPLLPANAPILRSLAMPPLLPVTPNTALPHREALAVVAAGLSRWHIHKCEGWLQIRRGDLSAGEWRDWMSLCAEHGVLPIANTGVDEARALGAAAVHLSATRLSSLVARPDVRLIGASVHTRAELDRAAWLGLDYVILGSVNATPTHPELRGLGWPAWQASAHWSPIPVYAIGGLGPDALDDARRHGATGLAMISAAWGTS